MIFYDFSSDKLAFVLVIFSFFTTNCFIGTFWKSKHLRQVLIISMFTRELLVLFRSTVYTCYPRIQTTNINSSSVSSRNTAQHRIQFLLISINFFESFNDKTFFNGNGCFDILTVHFFINIKKKYLPDMLNMEIKTRNI